MITGVEIKRKSIHMSTLVVPVGYALTSKKAVILFLVPFFLAFLTVDLLRHYHSGIASLFQKYVNRRVLRGKEQDTLMGATYFLFSTIMVILIFPHPIAIASLFILILADTAAALVGKGIGRIGIFGKTLEGSMAFLLTALLIVWLYPGLNRFSGSLAALGAAVIEVLPIKVDDNLSIPLVAGAIMLFAGG